MSRILAVPDVSVRRLTQPPGDHFFGYYEKTPWSPSGSRLLGMRVGFRDRQPRPDDEIELGPVDPAGECAFEPFATTQAWCWQQGTMLQWLPGQAERVVYNERRAGRFRGVVHDLASGDARELERAVYAVDPKGRHAVGLNFARLATQRPGYGYEGVPDPWADDPAPAEDGVWTIDLATGRAVLALALAEIVDMDPDAGMAGQVHWLNHAQINTDGTRVAVLHRWQPSEGPRQTRLITLGSDGSDPRVIWAARLVSHYDWRSTDEILAWGGAPATPNGFWRVSDAGAEPQLFAPDIPDRGRTLLVFAGPGVDCERYVPRPRKPAPADDRACGRWSAVGSGGVSRTARAGRSPTRRPAPALESGRNRAVHRLGARGDAADVHG